MSARRRLSIRFGRPVVVGSGADARDLARRLHARFAPLDAVATPEAARAVIGGAPAVVVIATPETDRDADAALGRLLGAAFAVSRVLAERPPRRLVLLSSQSFFSRLPGNWSIDPRWRPRPTPALADLAPHLVELSVREAIRETGVDARVIRLGTDLTVPSAETADAVRAALADTGGRFFEIRHLGRRPAAALDDRPWREVLGPPEPVPSRPIRNVVVFGAGGPLAAALAPLLMAGYRVRLTDVRPLDEIRAAGHPHQPLGSPLPDSPAPPHEEFRCDITDPEQVLAACAGMDAIVNCSVVRNTDDDLAVNALGCLNLARAAAAHGIRRIVQTGPQLSVSDDTVGYHADYDVPGDAPARPGRSSYGHTKYLGSEILRVFAEWHDLEVAVLLFNGFVTAESRGRNAFESTFEDSADAILRALEAPDYPSPFETVTVCADLPMGRFSPQRAIDVLGWHPRASLDDTWSDPSGFSA